LLAILAGKRRFSEYLETVETLANKIFELEVFMKKDVTIYNRKKYLFAILLTLLACMTTLKVPYQGKTISELILPVIIFDSSALYLSGLITLGLIIWSSRMFIKSGKYKNQFIIVLVILLVVMPLFAKGYNYLKSPVYMLSEGVRGIELRESDLNIHTDDGKVILDFYAEVLSYINDDTAYEITVKLPNNLKEITKEDSIIVHQAKTMQKGHDFTIEYSGALELVNGYTSDYLFREVSYFEDYWVILKDNEKSIEMTVNNGLF